MVCYDIAAKPGNSCKQEHHVLARQATLDTCIPCHLLKETNDEIYLSFD